MVCTIDCLKPHCRIRMELRIFIIVLGRWYENVLYYSQIQPVGIVYFKVDYHSTTIRVVEMWLQVLHKPAQVYAARNLHSN